MKPQKSPSHKKSSLKGAIAEPKEEKSAEPSVHASKKDKK